MNIPILNSDDSKMVWLTAFIETLKKGGDTDNACVIADDTTFRFMQRLPKGEVPCPNDQSSR